MTSKQLHRPENTAALSSSSESEGARPSFQVAMERARPLALALLLVGITLSFVVPGIALCGVASLSGIVWAIAGTTLACGFCYWIASLLVERESVDNPLVLDLQLSGVATVAAGLLWFDIAVQTGPIAARVPGFWSSVAIGSMVVVASLVLMHRRARRIA